MQLPADYFTAYHNLKLTRDDKGVLVAEFHSNGGPFVMSAEAHTGLVDAFCRISQDRANKIVILAEHQAGEWLHSRDRSQIHDPDCKCANRGICDGNRTEHQPQRTFRDCLRAQCRHADCCLRSVKPACSPASRALNPSRGNSYTTAMSRFLLQCIHKNKVFTDHNGVGNDVKCLAIKSDLGVLCVSKSSCVLRETHVFCDHKSL